MNKKNQNKKLKMKNCVRTWPFGLVSSEVPLENSDLFEDRSRFGTRSGVFNGDSHGVSFNSLRIFHSISSCKATSSILKPPRSCSIRPGAVGLRIYDGCEKTFESSQIKKGENLHASSVPFVIEDQNDQLVILAKSQTPLTHPKSSLHRHPVERLELLSFLQKKTIILTGQSILYPGNHPKLASLVHQEDRLVEMPLLVKMAPEVNNLDMSDYGYLVVLWDPLPCSHRLLKFFE